MLDYYFQVLCLHIKRFRWSPYSRTKIDTHVDFPLQGLDMSQYLLSNLHDTRCSNSVSSLYDLAAVIVHHGSGAGSGHYTAFGTKNSNWYHFNDSTVSTADPNTVKHCKAYILFYIQREFKLPPMTWKDREKILSAQCFKINPKSLIFPHDASESKPRIWWLKISSVWIVGKSGEQNWQIGVKFKKSKVWYPATLSQIL